MDQLAHIIQDLDARHGNELSGGYRLILEAVLGEMAENGELAQKAMVNSKENFVLVFSGVIENEVMKTENSNKAFFARFFSDEDFRNEVIRDMGAEFHRRHGGEKLALQDHCSGRHDKDQ